MIIEVFKWLMFSFLSNLGFLIGAEKPIQVKGILQVGFLMDKVLSSLVLSHNELTNICLYFFLSPFMVQ